MPSSVIRAYEYDVSSKTLLIVFQSGRRYRYLEVPLETVRQMRAAPAKGVFFNAHIRRRFAYRQEESESP
jgi:lysyl-tRNA synthetase class 2